MGKYLYTIRCIACKTETGSSEINEDLENYCGKCYRIKKLNDGVNEKETIEPRIFKSSTKTKRNIRTYSRLL